MIVNDVIWSAEEDACGHLCVQNVLCVPVCSSNGGRRYFPRFSRGSFYVWGGAGSIEDNEVQCLCKHDCVHLLYEWEASPLQSLIPTPSPLLIICPRLLLHTEQESKSNYYSAPSSKPFQSCRMGRGLVGYTVNITNITLANVAHAQHVNDTRKTKVIKESEKKTVLEWTPNGWLFWFVE